MKAQNAKERTRAILQFAGLFVLATLLAGSTVYLPGSVTRKSYEQLEEELNRYKAQAATQRQFAAGFARHDQAIRGALAKADSLVRELEKLPAGTRTSAVDLREALVRHLDEARVAVANAEKMTKGQPDRLPASLLAAYAEAVVDKKKVVEYVETVQKTADQPPVGDPAILAKLDRQEAQIEKLQDDKMALKQKYDQCVSSMSNDCRILNNRISQYEDHFKKIMDYASTIEKAAIEVKGNKREVVIGNDYKIKDLEKFNEGLNRIENQSKTIKDLAVTKK